MGLWRVDGVGIRSMVEWGLGTWASGSGGKLG